MKTITVSKGSVSIKIYPSRRGRHFTIAYRDPKTNLRCRAVRSTEKSARDFADERIEEILSGLDRATVEETIQLRRAQKHLDGTGLSIDEACRRERDRLDKLTASPIDCPPISELSSSLITELKQDGRSSRWIRTLESQLEKFAAHFRCPLPSITRPQFETWLRELPVKLLTRQNYHAAVLQLVYFAKTRNHLPENWDHIPAVKDRDSRSPDIRILTPAQLRELLRVASPAIRPLIILGAFCGIRHEEICSIGKTPLDWSHVNLDRAEIYVPESNVKTNDDRLVPIPKNALAWLRLDYKTTGPICALKNSSNALTRSKRAAGIPAGKNQTRNTLRKSCISYRKAQAHDLARIASDCGTSERKIRDNYKRTVAEDLAKEWFNILPDDCEFTQKLLPFPVTKCDKPALKPAISG